MQNHIPHVSQNPEPSNSYVEHPESHVIPLNQAPHNIEPNVDKPTNYHRRSSKTLRTPSHLNDYIYTLPNLQPNNHINNKENLEHQPPLTSLTALFSNNRSMTFNILSHDS